MSPSARCTIQADDANRGRLVRLVREADYSPVLGGFVGPDLSLYVGPDNGEPHWFVASDEQVRLLTVESNEGRRLMRPFACYAESELQPAARQH